MISSLFATSTLPSLLRQDEADPMTQIAMAEAADRGLLRLVACAAAATLLLAVAASLTA
jgi:hypothetical protein